MATAREEKASPGYRAQLTPHPLQALLTMGSSEPSQDQPLLSAQIQLTSSVSTPSQIIPASRCSELPLESGLYNLPGNFRNHRPCNIFPGIDAVSIAQHMT